MGIRKAHQSTALLVGLVLLSVGCVSEQEAATRTDTTVASTNTTTEELTDEPVTSTSRLDTSGQLGICAPNRDASIECLEIRSSSQVLQVAVIENGTGPTRLFVPGGPGQDVTKSTSFEAGRWGKDAGRLIVLGEPGSSLSPGPECAAAVQSFADWLLSNSQPPKTDQPHGAMIAEACQEEIESYKWGNELLDQVATFLTDYDVEQVVTASFGSRTLAALAASPSFPAESVEVATLVAPAPSAEEMNLEEVVAARSTATVKVICDAIEHPVCGTNRSSVDRLHAAALVNAAYNWEGNRVFFAEADLTTDSVLSEFEAAARAVSFVDPIGVADPQLLAYLAIQCSAYAGNTAESMLSDEPIRQYLGSLLSPCEEISNTAGALPGTVLADSFRQLCVLYSRNDPVTGELEAETFRTNASVDLAEIPGLTSGHRPNAIIERTATRPKSKALQC